MLRLDTLKDCPTVNANGCVTLLVKQAGSATADALARGFRAAGLPPVVLATPYDSVTEAARRDAPVGYLVVGVDYFDAEAFRLLPLFRREWPTTTIVAYHSPGFEHKGSLAGLVGADVVLSRPDELLDFLAALSRPAEPAVAPPQPKRQAAPSEPSPLEQETAPREALPSEPRPPVEEEAPSAIPTPDETNNLGGEEALAGRRVPGTVELTDEELRILLGEDDDT